MVLLFAVWLGIAAAAIPALAGPSFQGIEESLTCQCGCGLTVHSCNHLQCPSAIPLRQEIRKYIGEGLDEEAILSRFASKYGEKILSSPTTSGFNLTAWITPFAALGGGVIFVALTLLRWRRGSAEARASTQAPAELVASQRPDLEERLERELRDLDA